MRGATDQFRIRYTGDGEGNAEDLASLAGTSTGFNWSSAMMNFSKDGDFHIVPYVMSNLVSRFTASANCLAVGQNVSFSNHSQVEMGGMFNVINRSGYTGANTNYNWDFGDGTSSTAANPNKSYATSGNYTVTLNLTHERWNGMTCTDQYSLSLSVGLAASSSNLVNASCHGSEDGSILINATGGAAPYEYALNQNAWTSSNSFNGLPAGNHSILVQDNADCQTSVSFTTTEPTQIVFSTTNATNSSCGQSNGAIFVSASGGTGTISYALNGITPQGSGSFQTLSSGVYRIEAIDANGCRAITFVTVND